MPPQESIQQLYRYRCALVQKIKKCAPDIGATFLFSEEVRTYNEKTAISVSSFF